MKNLKYLFALGIITICLSSCKENDIPVFDAGYSALNIWFGTSAIPVDSTTYNYSYSLGADTLKFYARVIGKLSDEDRTFSLEAYDGDLTEAEGSFFTTTYTIKAGESEAQFPIVFDTSKLKDANSFTQKDGHLYFKMKENTTFKTGATSMNELRVVLKNYISKPADWDAATYPLRPYTAYFGAYSKVKYQFMIQILGLVDFHISYSQGPSYIKETNTVSHYYATYLVQRLQLALDEYNSSHDSPLKDETGSLVVF